MSWQEYVNKQLMASKCVTKAAIVGHDGNVWAKSDGFEVGLESRCDEGIHFKLRRILNRPLKFFSLEFKMIGMNDKCLRKHHEIGEKEGDGEVSKDELVKLVQAFEDQHSLTSAGVTLGGTRYIYLSGTDRVIRAKLGKVGVHCMKTTQAVVVSLYEDPIQPQEAASVVEKLGDFLVSYGY